MNPYHDQTFFGFLIQFLWRFISFIKGEFSWHQLASDEIQILVIAGVAASSALVGTFLVLRRMTMLANSLSHTILIGIVIAYLLTRGSVDEHGGGYIVPLNAMLISCMIVGLLTTFLTQFLTHTGRLQEDASTGLVFTSLFATGVILVTLLTRDVHLGLEAVMGNADALHIDDLKFVGWIFLGNALIFSVFYKEFQITTFDPGLARALGFSTLFFNYLLMAQVSATSIGAFRAVGVLLVLAFMTGPVLTARLLTSSLKKLLLLSVAIGVGISFVGVALTRHILTVYGVALSTAGVVVSLLALTYALALVGSRLEFTGQAAEPAEK